jgi:cell division protein FtsB
MAKTPENGTYTLRSGQLDGRNAEVAGMKWICAVLLGLGAAVAHAEPWLCTDAWGNKQFSYDPESATLKNCVNHPIPSGNVWRAVPRGAARAQSKPPSFPKVDAQTQKQRDVARRQILERELAEEKKALAAAIEELAEQKQRLSKDQSQRAQLDEKLKPYAQRIRVHLTNITNLEKELGVQS